MQTRSAGFPVRVVSVRNPDLVCEDYSLNVVAHGNDRFDLNEDTGLDGAEMLGRLNEKLRYRADKLVYVHAGRDLFYEDFLRMIDTIYRPDQTIGVVTERVEEQYRTGEGCLVASAAR
ncbi:MAG TPA: hypothetical protein VHC90_12685 [Bryobacteraceae bacterium]|nr:hypothetical protein [Bryobacteraceae bacterium]